MESYRVKNQVSACAIAFRWTWNKHRGKTERMVSVAKNSLRSDLRVKKKFTAKTCPSRHGRCVLHTHWMCPWCRYTHLTWIGHLASATALAVQCHICINFTSCKGSWINFDFDFEKLLFLSHELHLSKHFSYLSTLCSQRVRISDSLCTVLIPNNLLLFKSTILQRYTNMLI